MKALQDKAAIYATATGYHIVRLVTLSEGGGSVPQPRPLAVYRMQPHMAANENRPRQSGPGEIDGCATST